MTRVIRSAILIAGLLNGCGHKSSPGAAPSTPAQTPAPDAGSAAGVVSTAGPATRDVSYTVTVTVEKGASGPAVVASPVIRADVQGIFNNHCVSCHVPGQTLDLTTAPWKTGLGSQGDLLSAILKRVQATDGSQMPPSPNALLTPAEVATLTAWQADGMVVTPPTNAAVAASYAQGLVVDLKIRAGGATAWTEATLPWNGTGVFLGEVPKQIVGSQLEAQVTVKGEDGRTLQTAAFTSLPVGPSNGISLPVTVNDDQVRAHAVDHQTPTPGGSGAITVSGVTETGFTIAFQPAIDALTDQSALTYAVYYSTADNVNTANDALKNGTKAQDFSPYATQVQLTGLTAGTSYHVAVLVQNRSGVIGIYPPLLQATAADTVPPVVDTPTLTVTAKTDTTATLNWSRSHDDRTAQGQLTYQVFSSLSDDLDTVANVLANGIPAGPPATDHVTANLAGMTPATKYYVTVLVADAHGNQSAYQRATFTTAAAGTSTLTELQFAKECATRLGTLPAFSCLDGQIGPITVNGKAIEATSYSFGTAAGAQQACDRPQLLGLGAQGHCMPYSRFGRLTAVDAAGKPRTDVDTMFGCRRYTAHVGPSTWQGQTFDGSVYPGFEDIAIIQHNRVTGETCFFQMLKPDQSPVDGRTVPSPTDAAAAPGFWLDPVSAAAKGCNHCHDSDPWVHSPYIDQIRNADGTPFVYAGGKGKPYSIVGTRGFSNWVRSVAVSSTVTTDTNGKSCTSCHDIGNLNTCAVFARQSAGIVLGPNLTGLGASWPLSHWMPLPLDAGIKSPVDWQTAGYAQAAAHQIDCCNAPNGSGCVTRPIMTAPPPYLVE